MKHVNDWCFRGFFSGGLWEEDLHYSVLKGESPILECRE